MIDMGKRQRKLIEDLCTELDDTLDELEALRQTVREYRETVSVLEDIAADMHRGWTESVVAADGLLKSIESNANVDPLGDRFTMVYLDQPSIEVLRVATYGVEPTEPTEDDELLQALADMFGVPVDMLGDGKTHSFTHGVEPTAEEAAAVARCSPVVDNELLQALADTFGDDSNAFAWAPHFDRDGAEADYSALDSMPIELEDLT